MIMETNEKSVGLMTSMGLGIQTRVKLLGMYKNVRTDVVLVSVSMKTKMMKMRKMFRLNGIWGMMVVEVESVVFQGES